MAKWNSIDSNPFNLSNSGYGYISLESSKNLFPDNWYKVSKVEKTEEDYSDCPFATKCQLKPDRVIFQPPATIVFWNDGTKTVVKTSEEWKDEFDPEVGFAMAFLRKYFGDRGTYLRIIGESAEWRHAPKKVVKNGKKME